MVRDLESVVDAAGLDRFPLLGISQGCAVAIGYAVRHPERVTRMVLHGGYAKGWRARGNPSEIAAPRGDADPGARRLGPGESGLSPDLRLLVHPGRQPGAVALVERPAADLDLAGECGHG